MGAHLAVPVLVLPVSVGETAAAQSGRLDYPQWRGRATATGPQAGSSSRPPGPPS